MNKWILAARIKTLPAGISPVLLGTALSYHDGLFHLFIFFMTLLAAGLIQIGANFANDVYDFQKGSDRDDRLGPTRATQSGLITPDKMKQGMWRIFALAIFVGFYLAYIGGWPIVVIGLTSITAGIAYTGGPYPLGYHGWGDLFVFIFFGLIAVPGTYFLQTGYITNYSLLLGVAMGMLSTAILVVNNIRDMDTDIITEKKTLAVRLGKSFSQIEFSILVIIPFIIPLCMWWNTRDNMSLLITLFALPIAINLIIQLNSKTGRKLNNVLAGTARFLFIFTILFSLGLII
ncbi:MAG: 1,4-dihydroxy-2-naphthoate polyprenyltransferase [Candidatus Marinimicrobia bacterium]|nr:1,4-dihydroxy-2-naphthoate polyprenyltransferase [Candidatus Neomarinimicrobiota bacterium]